MQFFYRWRSCIDRSVRLAEEAKFVHQRDSLMADMRAMHELMLQSSVIEKDAYAASIQRGNLLTSKIRNSAGADVVGRCTDAGGL